MTLRIQPSASRSASSTFDSGHVPQPAGYPPVAKWSDLPLPPSAVRGKGQVPPRPKGAGPYDVGLLAGTGTRVYGITTGNHFVIHDPTTDKAVPYRPLYVMRSSLRKVDVIDVAGGLKGGTPGPGRVRYTSLNGITFWHEANPVRDPRWNPRKWQYFYGGQHHPVDPDTAVRTRNDAAFDATFADVERQERLSRITSAHAGSPPAGSAAMSAASMSVSHGGHSWQVPHDAFSIPGTDYRPTQAAEAYDRNTAGHFVVPLAPQLRSNTNNVAPSMGLTAVRPAVTDYSAASAFDNICTIVAFTMAGGSMPALRAILTSPVSTVDRAAGMTDFLRALQGNLDSTDVAAITRHVMHLKDWAIANPGRALDFRSYESD